MKQRNSDTSDGDGIMFVAAAYDDGKTMSRLFTRAGVCDDRRDLKRLNGSWVRGLNRDWKPDGSSHLLGGETDLLVENLVCVYCTVVHKLCMFVNGVSCLFVCLYKFCVFV